MHLGEILIGRGVLPAASVHAALDRQRREGGRLGDNLVALGLISPEHLASLMTSVAWLTPALPLTLRDTGIVPGKALNLMLKFMLRESLETVADLSAAMKLPPQAVRELMDDAVTRKLVQPLGTTSVGFFADLRFALSREGQAAAADAFAETMYLGPAPVSLAAFQAQVKRQTINDELLGADQLRGGLDGLMISERSIRKLLPAINAGRTMLLFGPPGNGKTTVATRIAALFEQVVYIPYAVEIAGQIMRVFDQGLHQPVISEADAAALAGREGGIQRETFDARWVACRRPFAIAGGELTLEMLDLQYDADLKFYEAPLHVKALNGVLLIDDFGRQRVKPAELLNRWIGPMENRVEYLKLHTGKSFSLPFDQLLVFSTNMDPRNLMDGAFLRRIPYKIKLSAPDTQEYRRIFDAEAAAHGVTLTDDVFAFIVNTLAVRSEFGLACFQPKFICAQVAEICRSFGVAPVLTRQLAVDALANLYVDIESEDGARLSSAAESRYAESAIAAQ